MEIQTQRGWQPVAHPQAIAKETSSRAACVQQIQPRKPLKAAQLESVPGGKDSNEKNIAIPFNLSQPVDLCFFPFNEISSS